MHRVALVIGVLALAACSGTSAEGEGARLVTTVEPPGSGIAAKGHASPEPSETTATTAEEAVGTRSNPLAPGAAFRIGDWELAVTSVEPDAAAVVSAENQFNDPPADGFRYVMFSVTATYVGAESGQPASDLSWAIVGSAGNTFDDRCGVIPDDFTDGNETFPGGVVSGNVCVAVEAGQLDGATILVEGGFGDDRTFIALN